MIINYPTGAYLSVLPKSPSDSGNVTYIVSMTSPPREVSSFIKTPPGQAYRNRSLMYTAAERRAVLAELAYTTVGNSGIAGSAMQQYEVGQTLEFVDEPVVSVVPMVVPDTIDERHDVNLFDYSLMGLDNNSRDVVTNAAVESYAQLQAQLSDAIRRRSDAEVNISNTQKLLNEYSKTISGIETILSLGPDDQLLSVLNSLTTRRNDANILLGEFISAANLAASDAAIIRDRATSVAQLVR